MWQRGPWHVKGLFTPRESELESDVVWKDSTDRYQFHSGQQKVKSQSLRTECLLYRIFKRIYLVMHWVYVIPTAFLVFEGVNDWFGWSASKLALHLINWVCNPFLELLPLFKWFPLFRTDKITWLFKYFKASAQSKRTLNFTSRTKKAHHVMPPSTLKKEPFNMW